jgi:putative N6-adenine-specific DNA methylase/tRNA (guanine6-N2)-methyltransferase
MINAFALQQVCDAPLSVLLTTNAGLETTVRGELRQHCREQQYEQPVIQMRPFGFAGHVLVTSERPLSYWQKILFQLRSVHHVQALIGSFELPEANPLHCIYEQIQAFPVPGLNQAGSFRITTNRNGKAHTFTSTQVQQYAGAGVLAQYPRSVSLEEFDVELRCDVFDNTVVLGLQLTSTSLINRHSRPFLPRVSLQPHMAYALLAQARITAADRALLDPFCGAGTILIEAAACYPWLQLTGTDYAERAITGAAANRQQAGIQERVSLQQLDVYELDQAFAPASFDVIVTNPPFGIKLNRRKAFHTFYQRVLAQGAYLLRPGGRLVMMGTKWLLLKKQIKQDNTFIINDIQKVKMGSVESRIFSLTLPRGDTAT